MGDPFLKAGERARPPRDPGHFRRGSLVPDVDRTRRFRNAELGLAGILSTGTSSFVRGGGVFLGRKPSDAPLSLLNGQSERCSRDRGTWQSVVPSFAVLQVSRE